MWDLILSVPGHCSSFYFERTLNADAQADLSLRWAHTHFVGFVMSRLKCLSCFGII